MPKINVYLPDELAEAVRSAGIPVSAICQRALEQAVRRITAIRQTTLTGLDADGLTEQFPQLTARTRAVVALAAERAGPTGISTGDLLNGMLTEGTNLALQVLQSMDVAPAHVAAALARTAVVEAAGTGPQHFTVPAANAVESAVAEAAAFGHNYVGCEHLLLGLVAEADGAAGRALRTAGADPRLTRRAVAAALAGYVHLRAQAVPSSPPAVPPAEAMAAVIAAVRAELQPVVARVEALERRLGP